ncbi:MAG: alpha/beta hydrolase [Myxococcota bacterium]|nr:alpha/beta hydrolase [Myxococcota bacterium]
MRSLNQLRRNIVSKARSFDIMRWPGTPYGSHPLQTMQIDELNDLCPRDGWPTVLMIHGGGWVEGSCQDYTHLAPLFARRGIMACAMNYRLAPENRWPAQKEDVFAALDFLRSQQVDLQRLALWGDSAGAHMALHAALDYPHPIAAVVAIGTPFDLTHLPTSLWGEAFLESQLQAASPVYREGSKLPPTLLLHGEKDRIVPVEQSRIFAQRFPQSTLWELEDGDHGLRWPLHRAWRLKRKAVRWLEQTLDLPKRGSKWKRRKNKSAAK